MAHITGRHQNLLSASAWRTVLVGFVSPSHGFRSLLSHLPWFYPYFLCAFGMLTLNLISMHRTLDVMVTTFDVGELPQSLRSTGMIGFWVGIVGLPWIVPIVVAFGYTAILGFIAPFVHTEQATFGRLYLISLWAMVPAFTLGNLVQALMVTFSGGSYTPASLSVAAILPSSAPVSIYVVARTLDVQSVWTFYLLAVGFVAAYSAKKRAVVVILGVFLMIRLGLISVALH